MQLCFLYVLCILYTSTSPYRLKEMRHKSTTARDRTKRDESALLRYGCNSLRLNILWQLCVNSDHHKSSSEFSGRAGLRQTLLRLVVEHALHKYHRAEGPSATAPTSLNKHY